jgi:SnoaL-like domain
MPDFQAEKDLVRRYHADLANARPDTIEEVLKRHVAPDWHWRGMHPFHELRGAEDVARVFWAPFMKAMTRIQRRPDIFIAGLNEMDGFQGKWVTQMGHLMANFDKPWLGIRPTFKIVMLRFVEFNHVVDGKIVETAMFFDILHLMMQAGQWPLPPQTGAHLIQPGPATHEGLHYGPTDPAMGEATLAAINAMLMNPSSRIDGIDEETRLQRAWHDDMIWWGPAGIGASYTIERYIKQHCEPFDEALSKGYRFNGHICRLAEGNFGGFFGWANLTLQNSGNYLGMNAGPGPADMRVVDMYRHEDGKLAENWIFIDILNWLHMQGLDVLGRMKKLNGLGV